jgi:hypothetical protein
MVVAIRQHSHACGVSEVSGTDISDSSVAQCCFTPGRLLTTDRDARYLRHVGGARPLQSRDRRFLTSDISRQLLASIWLCKAVRASACSGNSSAPVVLASLFPARRDSGGSSRGRVVGRRRAQTSSAAPFARGLASPPKRTTNAPSDRASCRGWERPLKLTAAKWPNFAAVFVLASGLEFGVIKPDTPTRCPSCLSGHLGQRDRADPTGDDQARRLSVPGLLIAPREKE